MATAKPTGGEMEKLLNDYLTIPKVGDVVKGLIISTEKNEVIIDIPGYRPGVVRGR